MIYTDILEDMFYNTMVSSIINRVPIIIRCTNMGLYSSIFVFEAFERFFRGGYMYYTYCHWKLVFHGPFANSHRYKYYSDKILCIIVYINLYWHVDIRGILYLLLSNGNILLWPDRVCLRKIWCLFMPIYVYYETIII